MITTTNMLPNFTELSVQQKRYTVKLVISTKCHKSYNRKSTVHYANLRTAEKNWHLS